MTLMLDTATTYFWLLKFTLKQLSMKSSKYDKDKNLLIKLHWVRKPSKRLKSKGNFRWKGENLRKCVISVFKFQP